MDARRWERVRALFDEVVDLEPGARGAPLERGCDGDHALRAEVEGLLREHDLDPDFLDRPLACISEGMAAPREPVRVIGPYRVVRPLGQGGMGEVLLAMDQREDLRRPVAVKVIRRGMDTDEVLRRFRTERRILASLRHEHIAQLLDGGATGDGRPYLVMEYVEGEPVDRYCDRLRLPLEKRLHLFLQVCGAVQHAHRNLVVHRDLKPGNILVTAAGVPKLMDFGIGKLVDADDAAAAPATRTGLRLLTPGYASPEQIRGDVVGVASDVYQLGVLLYELLTGHRPYEGEEGRSAADLERAVLHEEPARPSTRVARGRPAAPGEEAGPSPAELAARRASDPRRLRRRLAGDLDTIVLVALRREPDRRYASAAALAEDVERHLAGLPVRARPDSFGYRAGRFLLRNRWPVSAAAVAVLALTGAAGYSFAQSLQVARQRDQAMEVQGFLLEMFGATGPEQTTGDSVTARQLLDRQVAALEAGYLDRPELRARMMIVLAEGYDRLGIQGAAEPLARAALELQRRELGPEHPDVAGSLGVLGWILHQGGRSEEGEALLREAVAKWRRSGVRTPRGLARALNDLGVVREGAGDYEEAESLYREALGLRRAQFGEGHRAFAVTASNLAVILYRKGDLEGAVAVGEQALAAMRAALGPDHQRSIIIQSNLAAFRVAMGDPLGAEADYRDLLARQTRLQGRGHPVTVRLIGSLGTTLESQGRWAEAEPMYREALALLEARLGPGHPDGAAMLDRLGRSLRRQGRPAEARPLAERAVAALVAARGEAHPATVQALENLAEVREALGDPEEAERLHRRAVAGMDAAVGPDHPDAAAVRLRLGRRLLAGGRVAEARELVAHAERVLAERLAPSHAAVVEARLHRADAERRSGAVAAADSLLALARSALDRGPHRRELHELLQRLEAARAVDPGESARKGAEERKKGGEAEGAVQP